MRLKFVADQVVNSKCEGRRTKTHDRQTDDFRVGCTPFLQRFFADSYGWASLFLFQLVSSSKSVRFAWKQHVLIASHGTEFEVLKFLCWDILQNLMQKQHEFHLRPIVKYEGNTMKSAHYGHFSTKFCERRIAEFWHP